MIEPAGHASPLPGRAFVKMSGGGNDFVVFDDRDRTFPVDGRVDLVARLCRRGLGVGADAVLLLQDDEEADVRMLYYNADGGEAPMCGNGAMCLARYALLVGAVTGPSLALRTGSGTFRAEVPDPDLPVVTLALVPPRDAEPDIDDLAVDPYRRVGFVNTSTPHLVALLDDAESLEDHPVRAEGSRLRHDPRWDPPGTNVNFIAVLDHGTVRMRTFEKGVEDETLSCGTGATASAILTAMWGLTASPVEVVTSGGTPLVVEFPPPPEPGGLPTHPRLTGHARIVYRGTLEEA